MTTVAPRPEAKITIAELRGLVTGESYRIKLIHHERVNPEYRGHSFDVEFIALVPDMGADIVRSDDPNALLVEARDRKTRMKYGFHGWLIDEIKALAVT